MLQQNNHTLASFFGKLSQGKVVSLMRVAVSVLCLGLIYGRLNATDWAAFVQVLAETTLLQGVYVVFAVLLVIANLGLEAARWRMCLAPIETRSWRSHFAAVLAGTAVGLPFTHLVGDYTGKLALARKHTAEAIPLLVATSFSQYWVSFCGGWSGLSFLVATDLLPAKLLPLWQGLTFWVAAMLIAYFFIPNVYKAAKAISHAWIQRLPKAVIWPSLSGLLGLSALRYGVIVGQYALLYAVFAPQGRAEVFLAGIAISLAIKTLVPFLSVAGMVGLRELLALTVLGSLGFSDVSILAVTLSVWLINVALPGLAGALVVSRTQGGQWWKL